MDKSLKAVSSIKIKALPSEVWYVLTQPTEIKKWLYGTEAISDWAVGSEIIFQGEYDGHTYKDKGNVLENIVNQRLKYNYWTGFSGLEDTPENYSIVTYEIAPLAEEGVTFTWRQEGFASEEGLKHTEQGLLSLLQAIKIVVEGN